MADEAKTFAESLQQVMDKKGVSVRGLARLLAGEDATHKQIEAKRSNVSRTLDGQRPQRRTAVLYANVLNAPELISAWEAMPSSRLAKLEKEFVVLVKSTVTLLQIAEVLTEEVVALGGTVPDAFQAAIEEALHTLDGAHTP